MGWCWSEQLANVGSEPFANHRADAKSVLVFWKKLCCQQVLRFSKYNRRASWRWRHVRVRITGHAKSANSPGKPAVRVALRTRAPMIWTRLTDPIRTRDINGGRTHASTRYAPSQSKFFFSIGRGVHTGRAAHQRDTTPRARFVPADEPSSPFVDENLSDRACSLACAVF